MGRRRKRWLTVGLVLLLGAGAITWGVGTWLIRPGTRPVGASPWPRSEDVTLATPHGAVRGWFVRTGTTATGAALLLHSARGDRRTMRSRADWFLGRGYDVLVPDLYGHGESDGDRLTFGARESAAATAGIRFLRDVDAEARIVVLGWSLGGGAALLAPQPLGADALVLEAVFPTIEEAIHDRVAMFTGPLAGLVTPLLTAQFEPRVGASMAAIRPIDHIGDVGCPVLVLAGAEDRRTPLAESRRLFAAARLPKRMHAFAGLAHVDFHRLARAEWEREVGAFLASLDAPGRARGPTPIE